jgi:hypothetical protein
MNIFIKIFANYKIQQLCDLSLAQIFKINIFIKFFSMKDFNHDMLNHSIKLFWNKDAKLKNIFFKKF